MSETREIKIKPLQTKTDAQNRLYIPLIIQRMIGAKPGCKFNLFVDDDNGLYFSKIDK